MARRMLAIACLLAVAVASLAVIAGSGGGEHTLRAAFQSATNVVPGNEVRIAGRKVGKVRSTPLVDGRPVLELEISDDRAWPLHKGTTARLAYGTTVGYAVRYVELVPGPQSNPRLPDGGLLTMADTDTPVEFDQVLKTMNREGRAELRGLLANMAASLDGRAQDIAPGLVAGSEGFDALADLMRELGHDRAGLETLVRAGAHTASAVADREREFGGLVESLAATYDELADHGRATRAMLDRFPGTLQAARATLARTDRSLAGLHELVSDATPGFRELRGFTPSAARTVRTLREVAPIATSTLDEATTAAPDITALLRAGAPFLRRLQSVADRSVPMLGCMRPYGPELAGFVSTWAGLAKNFDAIDHHARPQPQVLPFSNGSQMTSAELVASTPGVQYAFPRPPGYNAGRPQFLPECGAGPEALDPTKDPEAAR